MENHWKNNNFYHCYFRQVNILIKDLNFNVKFEPIYNGLNISISNMTKGKGNSAMDN